MTASQATYRALCAAHSLKPNRALVAALETDLALLRRLDLSAAYIGPKQCLLIGQLLPAMPALEFLSVAGNDPPPEFLDLLADALVREPCTALPRLREVDLGGMYLGVEAAEVLLDVLTKAPQLRAVGLAGSVLDDGVHSRITLQLEVNRSSVAPQTADAARPGSASRPMTPQRQLLGSGAAVATAAAPEDTDTAAAFTAECEWLTNAGDLAAEEARLAELEPHMDFVTAGEGSAMSPASMESRLRTIDNAAFDRAVGGQAHDDTYTPLGAAAAAEAAAALNGLSPAGTFGRRLEAILDDMMRRPPSAASAVVNTTGAAPVSAAELARHEAMPAAYVDPEFPPAASSLVGGCARPTTVDPFELADIAREAPPFTVRGHHVVWQRLTDRLDCEAPVAVVAPSRTFIVPSKVASDAWLVNAMHVVASGGNPSVALSALVPKAYPELGLFCVHVRKSDVVVRVVVDDYVPVSAETGELLCCHSADPNELWPALVEKAMAKLHGSYDALCRGSMASGLCDLVGGYCTKRTWDLSSARRAVASGEFFDTLHSRLRAQLTSSVLAAVPVANTATQQQALRATGLAPNRAYVVDAAVQLAGYQVLRLRQPDLGRRWRGKFGPGSAELEEHSQALMWSEGAAETHFWCTVEDFAAFFSSLYTLEHQAGSDDEARAITKTFIGHCVDEQHGGLLGRDALWTENPTVAVTVPRKNTRLAVIATQPDQRLRYGSRQSNSLQYSNGVQLYVLATPLPPSATGLTPAPKAELRPPSTSGRRDSDLPTPLPAAPAPQPGATPPSNAALPVVSPLRGPRTGTPSAAVPWSGGSALGADDVVRGRRRDWNLQRDLVAVTPLARSRDVVAELVLQPGYSYSVVSACDGAASARLRLKLVSLSCFDARPVESDDVRATLTGAWDGFSAGGAAFDSEHQGVTVQALPTAVRAPQYRFRVQRNGQRVTVLLAQSPHSAPRVRRSSHASSAFTVAAAGASPSRGTAAGGGAAYARLLSSPKSPSATSLVPAATTAGRTLFHPIGFVVASGVAAFADAELLVAKRVAAFGYREAATVAATVELDAGSYIIVPCTLLAGQETTFSLHLFSDAAVNLTRVSI